MRRKLDPDLALKVPWSQEEDELLLRLQEAHDNHWAEMAKSIQGRNAQMCRTRCRPCMHILCLQCDVDVQLLLVLTWQCFQLRPGLHARVCRTSGVHAASALCHGSIEN